MAQSVFPVPSSAAGPSAFTTVLGSAMSVYEIDQAFAVGVYTATCSDLSANARLQFFDGTSIISTQVTASGVAVFSLTSAATGVFMMSLAGAPNDMAVTLALTATATSPDDIGNGTLDTINTTGTYNQTGVLGVLVLSGGAAGAAKATNDQNAIGGDGGRAGFINGGVVITNSATTVTIGAGGVADRGPNTAPTNSSFGNLITATAASNVFTNGNGGIGDVNNANGGNASTFFTSFNGASTTGGGAGANKGSNSTRPVGGGSGIGTGGQAAASNASQGGAGTGKASGGAGGKGGYNQSGQTGGDGTAGVVYVLRGF